MANKLKMPVISGGAESISLTSGKYFSRTIGSAAFWYRALVDFVFSTGVTKLGNVMSDDMQGDTAAFADAIYQHPGVTSPFQLVLYAVNNNNATDDTIAAELQKGYGLGCRFFSFRRTTAADYGSRLRQAAPKTKALGNGVGWVSTNYTLEHIVDWRGLNGWLVIHVFIDTTKGQYPALESSFGKFWEPPAVYTDYKGCYADNGGGNAKNGWKGVRDLPVYKGNVHATSECLSKCKGRFKYFGMQWTRVPLIPSPKSSS